MSAIGKFEAFVENLLEGSFARLLHSELQPVEIAKRLGRAMDVEQMISVGKILVPNEYRVLLHPQDYAHYEPIRDSLSKELVSYLRNLAKEQRFTILQQPKVILEQDAKVAKGQVQVIAHLVDQTTTGDETHREMSAPARGETQKIPAKEINMALESRAILKAESGPQKGFSFLLDKPSVSIGRAWDNDIILEDEAISRHHAEVRLTRGMFSIHDLQSTNGSAVNGKKIGESFLKDGDRVSLGGFDFIFKIEGI